MVCCPVEAMCFKGVVGEILVAFVFVEVGGNIGC